MCDRLLALFFTRMGCIFKLCHYLPWNLGMLLHARIKTSWRAAEEKGDAAPIKAKTQLPIGKLLATVCWDKSSILHIYFLYVCRTINAACHCELFSEVTLAYHCRRHDQPIRKVILLHDEAKLHTAVVIWPKWNEMGWTPLEHFPCNPDLSPCDFDRLGQLKEAPRG